MIEMALRKQKVFVVWPPAAALQGGLNAGQDGILSGAASRNLALKSICFAYLADNV